jgi:hypothetical protein
MAQALKWSVFNAVRLRRFVTAVTIHDFTTPAKNILCACHVLRTDHVSVYIYSLDPAIAP